LININNNQTKLRKNNVISNIQYKTSNANKNKEDIMNVVGKNNNNPNSIINNNNEKCNHILLIKKNQNVRYKHPNAESVNMQYNNNIKNLCNSMSESERKNKKLSVSHNKSKSGTGSIIKYHAQDYNIFNIKSGNVVKLSNNYNLKKFKSISPKIQRRNGNPGAIKDKKKAKSKSQSRSKTKSKNHSKNEYDKNNYLLNGKYNNNSNKQKSFKEKMDSILSKNIIALTKKIRKSQSPKIRISRPALIKNVINNPQKENMKQNINYRNNILGNCNGGNQCKKNKNSPSPVSFRALNNNTNYIYNTNANCTHKKLILCSNNNQNNDNLLLINNIRKAGTKRKIANSPNNIINQNSSEHCENSGIKISDKKINHQSSYTNKKNNIVIKNRSSFGPRNNNMNNVGNNAQKIQIKKLKNSENISKKNTCSYKFDDYNPVNERKKSMNVNLLQCNKKPANLNKKSFIGNMVSINKNIIINDINKKNNVVMNNIYSVSNINNNNTNKKQMTIIQNFSKYKKKGTINITNKLCNMCNICNKNQNQCHKENMSNNFFEDIKIYEVKENKKNKNLNINNVVNRTIDEKRKKNEYNHSMPKVNDNANNCYTN
jgi:hypothetical protein